ncbi:hypothetical protein [Chryseoglobus sp. 28M-23]|uniref:hypothetical protein n=1 Tax=Chryseoglobus sp. 28M-23 TaxID=2772253 RepID=UPI00174604A8|nr:hypothetical protein [Chryseoglobus sp. 28M-23]QOD93524.1 hypothetical protein IE160_11585 [Chryseoglobus sp. 28M-23]
MKPDGVDRFARNARWGAWTVLGLAILLLGLVVAFWVLEESRFQQAQSDAETLTELATAADEDVEFAQGEVDARTNALASARSTSTELDAVIRLQENLAEAETELAQAEAVLATLSASRLSAEAEANGIRSSAPFRLVASVSALLAAGIISLGFWLVAWFATAMRELPRRSE